MLNKIELEILKHVKERLEEELAVFRTNNDLFFNGYMCHLIQEQARKMGEDAKGFYLAKKITDQMDGRYTFDTWMTLAAVDRGINCESFRGKTVVCFETIMARHAWVSRILERGEITPDHSEAVRRGHYSAEDIAPPMQYVL